MIIFFILKIPGDYDESVKVFNTVLSVKADHHVWFRREMSHYYKVMQHRSLKTYNFDENLRVEVKHGMSHPDGFVIPKKSVYKSYGDKSYQKNVHNNEMKISENLKNIEYFVRETGNISRLVQLDHPGFLPNQRQYRQFGLAVLQIAQTLREHVSLLHDGKVH